MPVRRPHNSSIKGTSHGGIAGFLSAVWARKRLIFVPTMLVCLASVVYVHLVTPQYLGQAAILVEVENAGGGSPDAAIDSLLVRLAAPNVAAKVIADLGLQRRAEFDPLVRGVGVWHSLLVGAGFASDPRAFSKQDRVQNAYFERLMIEKVGASRVINVGFRSQDGELAASIANRVAEEALRPASVPASAAMTDSSAELTRRLAQVEARITTLREVDARGSIAATTGDGDISSAIRAQHMALQSRANMVREAVRLGRITETSDVTSQEGVKKLLDQRAQIKNRITLDERTLPPTHPRMKEAYTQLNSVDSQLRMVADRVANGFENEARALATRHGLVIAEPKNSDQAGRDVQITALEAEAKTLRDQLTVASSKTIAASGDDASPFPAKIITRASVEKIPIYPNKFAIISGSTLAMFFASFVFVILLHVVIRNNHAIEDDEESPQFVRAVAANSENNENTPVSFQWARNIPHPLGLESSGVVAPNPTNQNMRGTVLPGQGTPMPLPPMPVAAEHDAPIVTSARRYEIPFIRHEGGGVAAAEEVGRELNDMGYLGRGKIVTVYGMERGARTSLHAMRLGRRMVKEGATIVVELFGQDNLYTRVAGQNLAGLGAYLDGKASIKDIIHRDARSKLHILPAGEPLMHKIFGQKCQDQLEAIIHALCQSYAHVIVDAGLVGSAGEMVVGLADATIIVTQNDAQTHSLTKAVNRLEMASGNPVFVILDDFKTLAVDQQANAPRIVGVVRR